MEQIKYLLFYWLEMRAIRYVFLALLSSVLFILMLGLWLGMEISVSNIFFILLVPVSWLVVEVRYAVLAWHAINEAYLDEDDYDEWGWNGQDGLYLDDTEGLNLSADDFRDDEE